MKAKIDLALLNKLKREHKLRLPDKEYEIRDTDLKGFVLRVLPTGRVVYTLVYARGKRVTIGTADKLEPSQARMIAKQYEGEHVKASHGLGEDPIAKKRQKHADTYEQFLDLLYKPHLEATLRKGVSNQENVKETMANLKGRFSDFLKLSLNEITPLLIEKWRQRRRQDGIKPASINRQLNDLRACLNRAVKWDALAASPFDKIEVMKTDSSAKVRYLTKAEETRLRAALDEREAGFKDSRQSGNKWRAERGRREYADLSGDVFADHLKPAVLLSLNTGLRQGELFRLKWADVNFEQSNLTVVGDTAKDGETRHIPLNPEALEIVKRWKAQPGVKSLWVFPGKSGEPLKNPRKAWVELLNDAKITDFRWHDLRHTFASNLVMAGVDLNTVRELLGHSDYKMTQRYAHLAPKHKQEAVDKLVSPGLAAAR